MPRQGQEGEHQGGRGPNKGPEKKKAGREVRGRTIP